MDILNDINLNGNKITSATLNNSVVGSNNTTTAGAIKYSGGSISYYNGSTWVTLGSGGNTTANSFFNVSDGTYTYTVTVTPDNPSRTVSFTSGVSGVMLISMMDQSVSKTLTVPTTYIKVTGDIVINQEYSGGHNITITHNLNTYNVIVQVWYKDPKSTIFELVDADINTPTVNTITVGIGKSTNVYSGTYKVVIFRGYEQLISSGNITIQGMGTAV